MISAQKGLTRNFSTYQYSPLLSRFVPLSLYHFSSRPPSPSLFPSLFLPNPKIRADSKVDMFYVFSLTPALLEFWILQAPRGDAWEIHFFAIIVDTFRFTLGRDLKKFQGFTFLNSHRGAKCHEISIGPFFSSSIFYKTQSDVLHSIHRSTYQKFLFNNFVRWLITSFFIFLPIN